MRLSLSAIERHFYSRQHGECVAAARAALPAGLLAATGEAGGGGFEDRPLTHAEEHKLLDKLLRLRQACCHPQARGRQIRGASRRLCTLLLACGIGGGIENRA